jgi:hypothetical protein
MLYLLLVAILVLCFIGAFFRSTSRMAVALIGLVAYVQPSTCDEIATWIVCALAVAAVVYFGWMIFGITLPSSEPEA